MWPFRKKIQPKLIITVKSVLCIPDFIEDKDQIFDKTSGAYMVAADILMDIKKERYYTFEIISSDLKVIKAFEVTDKGSGLSGKVFNYTRNPGSVLRISANTGNIQEANALAHAGAMLLETGGMGITVDSAGKFFEKSVWLELTKRNEELACLYEMFVSGSAVDKKGNLYSCGMHNLGYADVMVLNEEDIAAAKLIRIFNFYQLVDKPVISSNQMFSVTADSPLYLIKQMTDQPHKGQELLENEFGMWSLERVN